MLDSLKTSRTLPVVAQQTLLDVRADLAVVRDESEATAAEIRLQARKIGNSITSAAAILVAAIVGYLAVQLIRQR